MKKALIFTLAGTAIFSGCATKKPQIINARPIAVSQVAPIAQNIERTTPGQVMDPQAEVFAQVPKRIVYLPGEHGLTGRRSPEQIAAYRLVKVSEIPEIQTNQPSTVILTDPHQNPRYGERDVINMTFFEEGQKQEGTARRLNIMEVDRIDIARGRIRQGETLRFFDELGWTGWIAKKETPKQEVVPPPLKPKTPLLPEKTEEPEPTQETLPPPTPEATPEPTPSLSPAVPPRLSPTKKP